MPAPGNPISMSQMRRHFKQTTSGLISLGQLYRGGGYLASDSKGRPGGTLTDIPASSTVRFSNYYHAMRKTLVNYLTPGTYSSSYLVPEGITALTELLIVGGGGGGYYDLVELPGGSGYGAEFITRGGGGGAGHAVALANSSVTANSLLTVVVGASGSYTVSDGFASSITGIASAAGGANAGLYGGDYGHGGLSGSNNSGGISETNNTLQAIASGGGGGYSYVGLQGEVDDVEVKGGDGGGGVTVNIGGTNYTVSGGGGGFADIGSYYSGVREVVQGSGDSGGGDAGNTSASNAAANTGGGGGGGGWNGGSGVVRIYGFQYYPDL